MDSNISINLKQRVGRYECFFIIDADSFQQFIESKASHLYLFYSKPFSMETLSHTVTSMELPRYTGNDRELTSLVISDLPNLTVFSTGCFCFGFVSTVSICKCDALQTITIGESSFLTGVFESPTASFSIEQCNQLKEVTFNIYACHGYKHFSIEGIDKNHLSLQIVHV